MLLYRRIRIACPCLNHIVKTIVIVFLDQQSIIQMGIDNSVILESHSVLQQNWQRENNSNVFVNKSTHEQVQRHYLKILSKDLPKQTSLFASRINGQQPYICRLHYFHLFNLDVKGHKCPETKEMWLYTDRLQLIKNWSREKIFQILLGLRKLIAMYGPFRVNENTVKQNEKGEVRLWISENPTSNYPDYKYTTQEQAVRDLETLLLRKKCQIAHSIMDCRNLREATEKLRKINTVQISNFKAVDGKTVCSKQLLVEKRINENPNIFKQGLFVQHKKSTVNGQLTPQKSQKKLEDKPQSLITKSQKKKLGSLNIGKIGYKQYGSSAKYGIGASVSQKKFQECRFNDGKTNNDDSFQLKKKQAQQLIAKMKEQKMQFQKLQLDYKKRQQKMLRNVNSVKQIKTFYPARFSDKKETLPAPITTHLSKSPKEHRNTYCFSDEHFQLNRFNSKSKINEVKILPGAQIKIKKANTPIIYGKLSSTNSDHNLLTKAKSSENMINEPIKINILGDVCREQERNYKIPIFIKQRKKQCCFLDRKGKIIPNCHQLQDIIGYNIQEKSCQVAKKRESKMPDNYTATKSAKNLDMSKYKESISRPFKYNPNFKQQPGQTVTPVSQNTLTFQSIDRQNNNSFESSAPHRTKTTQFYAKSKNNFMKCQVSIQDKSFATIQKKDSKHGLKQQQKTYKYLSYGPSIMEDVSEQLSAQSPRHQKTLHKKKSKSNLKNELRQEFKCLLGEDIVGRTQKRTSIKSQEDITEQEDNMIKNKIKMKKKAFAELKKQVFKVLADF